MIDLPKKTARAWNRLLKAHARLTGALEAVLKAEGLPSMDVYAVLAALEKAPAEGLRPFELEVALEMAQYNVSRVVDRMCKAGLAERAPCAEDRRGWRLRTTSEGAATRARMADLYRAFLADRVATPLTDKRIRQLDQIMGDLLDGGPVR